MSFNFVFLGLMRKRSWQSKATPKPWEIKREQPFDGVIRQNTEYYNSTQHKKLRAITLNSMPYCKVCMDRCGYIKDRQIIFCIDNSVKNININGILRKFKKLHRCLPTVKYVSMVADHIVSIQDGGHKNSLANYQSICPHHHSIKTNYEINKRKRHGKNS